MASCQYCNNLDIPSYQAVARSRGEEKYDGLSAIPSATPRGLNPVVDIALEDILSGARVTRCAACTMLKDGLLATFDGTLKDVIKIRCISSSRNTLDVTVSMNTGYRHLEFYTLGGYPTLWPVIGPGRQVSVDSSSDECIKLATNWIRDCIENHRDCHHSESTLLPTRVVNVGSDTTEPYLYITRLESAKYTTLSHCWGGKVPMTTTLATLEQRQHEITFSELPKTFQDAITITRKLNVSYLWIDSLCIIQDSEQDWTAEAAKMGSVYRNCVVCIAADGAPDSNGGCFIPGDIHRNFDIACVKSPGLDASPCAVHIREGPELMAGRGFAHVRHTSESHESELDTRGWVLQEQALSPRTLHYTVAELAWDCSQWSQCECSVRPKETGGNTHGEQLRACKSMLNLSKRPLNPDASVGDSRWANLVELFTERTLTYDKDRLHALSGIAADISQSRKNDAFLAGLWRAELPLALLWRTRSNPHNRMTVISRRYPDYYAPSWSWASVTGPIEFIALPGRRHNFKLVPDLTIVDAACEPVGTNPYGPVRTGGYLRVRGLLAPITLHEADSEERLVGYSSSSTDSWARTVARICSIFDTDVLDGGEIELINGEPLWLLLVAHGERCSPGFSCLEGHHCIVLRTSRLRPENTFERVGCAWALKKEHWADELAKRAEWRTLTLL